ncbi:MAG TPA: SRPBCC family protein [Solirubrobacteraceae bacterium]|nr:SRPBCC family protein [Solirubrobacteraceae bacterium]
MDPVRTSILIGARREQVFDFLADIANHVAFTDHFLRDWHLTRERSVGLGAGARFRVRAPGMRFSWGDVTFTEVRPPHLIVEEGRMGKGNRIATRGVYELVEGPGATTRVTFTFQSRPVMLSDRIAEALGGRRWVARMQRRALWRLRDLMEAMHAPEHRGAAQALAGAVGGAGAGVLKRVTVADG